MLARPHLPAHRTRTLRAASPGHGARQIDSSPNTLLDQIADPARAGRTTLIDAASRYSYAELLGEAIAWRDALLSAAPFSPGDRVAYLIPPTPRNVAVLLGIWLARGVAVPLAISHPLPELEHVLADARPRAIVADPAHPITASAPARSAAILTPHAPLTTQTPIPTAHPAPTDPALLIYTSGTTGRPKGVLTTHANVTAQITALTTAWAWTERDRILHTLPLHHIHGLVNALACALWSGAAVEFGSGAPASTWDRLASGQITLFMAVPTVYARLIRAWEEAASAVRERWSRGSARLRLMVSGSAALPAPTLERWREITGHTLLERYGMTEIGMALSNPLIGERRPGHVGLPLPGVEVRLAGDGEIEVRGPQVFQGYRGRPAETAAAFRDGWFRTGDEACLGEGGYYRILGRQSVDIVKTGGYKVSALEVEELYRTHPRVRDIAVVGVEHPEWGEQLRAAWVPGGGGGAVDAAAPDGAELRAWGKKRLAPYKVPHEFAAVPSLPRSAMGKVQKRAVRRMLLDRVSDTTAGPGTASGPGDPS